MECGKLIEATGVATRIDILGNGAPVIILHGGPGFDHHYLVDPLSELADQYRLVFFDQLGCGGSPAKDAPVTAQQCFEHAHGVISQFVHKNEPINIITHSFGALVLLGSMMQDGVTNWGDNTNLNVIFINPMPITYPQFFKAITDFSLKLPADTRNQFNQMMTSGEIANIDFRNVLPLYISKNIDLLASRLNIYPENYMHVIRSLPQFDFREQVQSFKSLHIIHSENDLVPENMLEEIITNSSSFRTIKDSGHFPFYDKPDRLISILRSVLIS